MTRKTLIMTGTVAALTIPATTAYGHVTLQPKTATPGSYTVENVRVPNETDDANTIKVDVRFPPGFTFVSTQRVAGWRVKVTKKKLAVPIKTDDGEITEAIDRVTWTAEDPDAEITPGAFQDFPISVLVPGKVGQALTFKALQTYDDGEVVRWIGGPDSDNPAPQVKLVEDPSAAGAGHAPTAPTAVPDARDSAGEEADDGDGLTLAALLVGGLGVLLGGAALLTGRRRTA